jgi:GNAT superfamily N-acetyltransferase
MTRAQRRGCGRLRHRTPSPWRRSRRRASGRRRNRRTAGKLDSSGDPTGSPRRPSLPARRTRGSRTRVARRHESGRNGPHMLTIDWFEGSREALADLFALADDSAAAVSRYRDLGRVLVARDGSTIVGHLQLAAGERDDEAEVKSLAVRQDRQGRGVGRLLIERAGNLSRGGSRHPARRDSGSGYRRAALLPALWLSHVAGGARRIHPYGRLSADRGRRHPVAGPRLALAHTVMTVPWQSSSRSA